MHGGCGGRHGVGGEQDGGVSRMEGRGVSSMAQGEASEALIPQRTFSVTEIPKTMFEWPPVYHCRWPSVRPGAQEHPVPSTKGA